MDKTVIIDIENSTFPVLSIPRGTSVVWRNKDPFVHSAEMNPASEPYFSAGAIHPDEMSSPVYFGTTGTYDYVCRYHHLMRGRIVVTEGGEPSVGAGQSHPGHHMTHFHGFVTGGASGQRLFMTHTPVMADSRHRFQVILRGRLVEPEHVQAYEQWRTQEFGKVRWQVFHAHMDMEKLGRGEIPVLEHATVTYSPDGVGEIDVPGLPPNRTPVRIDEVLHFHAFEPRDRYPATGLEYILYGDDEEVFMDHHITRAPNFHSVARLAAPPDFWTGEGPVTVMIPSKRIVDVSPKHLPRVGFVDNAFHLIWLPPSGLSKPVDPLVRRDESPAVYEVVLSDGGTSQVEIADFLHFDVRLLNYGVFLPDED